MAETTEPEALLILPIIIFIGLAMIMGRVLRDHEACKPPRDKQKGGE